MKEIRKVIFVGGCNHGNVLEIPIDVDEARILVPEGHSEYVSAEQLEADNGFPWPDLPATHFYQRAKLRNHDVFIGPGMLGEGKAKELVTPDIMELLRTVDQQNTDR